MKNKVVFSEVLFPDLKIEEKILEQVDAEVVGGACKTEDDLVKLAKDADAVVTFAFKPVSARVLAGLRKCKIVVRGGIGVDTVDIPAATGQGIIVANVPRYCVEEVSNLSIAMMLSLLHKIPVAMKHTSRGVWDYKVVKPIRSLWALTVGIVGFGNIGRASARKAAAFGMKVIVHDPYLKDKKSAEASGARLVELDDLLAEADAILLHAPATADTYHIINRETLKKVKRGCMLVNAARGQLVDTVALVEALENGTLSGAGLDLIENVPPLPKDHPLLGFENVIITPYYAWYTEDSGLVLRKTIANEIVRVLSGQYPEAIVNSDVKINARAGKLK